MTNQTHLKKAPRWSREEIRRARSVPLAPLLREQGLCLMEREAGNFELQSHPGLLIKESYWRWPQHHLAGNTIDFYMRVLKMSFHQAMLVITKA